jgi:hypothetical protein
MTKEEDKKEFAVIRINDSSEGIDLEILPRFFDNFATKDFWYWTWLLSHKKYR